jgi:Eco29kI restriction endonuclease
MTTPPQGLTPNAFFAKLKKDVEDLSNQARSIPLTPQNRKRINDEIEAAAANLNAVAAELDPIKRPRDVFDPGNPRTIGFFIALALTAQPRQSLSSFQPRYGAGIYALYYNGGYPLYEPINQTETPIYVGQAAPGTLDARTPTEQGPRLAARLNEHRKTILKASTSLNIDDFECRALAVQSGWETPAEDYLIRLFRPIWNKETGIIQGFGKHGDSPTKRSNKVSSWDVLHHGRAAAGHGINPAQKTVDALAAELSSHFDNFPTLKTADEVIQGFIKSLKQS